MAYNATVIPVMIASPGDVIEERDAIRNIIHDWNDINAQHSQIVLAAIGWDSHISPDLSQRPQEIINKQILKDCDILIGVFWTRLGTPTGKSLSGTVEEIEEHANAGKPAMIYFSSKPIAPDNLDSDQYEKVKQFKERCKTRGLFMEYENIEDFRKKLGKQLQICLKRHEYIQKILSETVIQDPSQDAIHGSSNSQPIDLSKEGAELLLAAASNDDGYIVKRELIGGTHISAGGTRYGDNGPRDFAKWNEALQELRYKGLIDHVGYEESLFQLTHMGWTTSDSLKENKG